MVSTVLPHGVILPEIGSEDFAFRRLFEPVLNQRFMLAFSLQRPTTLAMRELARRVRIELTKAIADGRWWGAWTSRRFGARPMARGNSRTLRLKRLLDRSGIERQQHRCSRKSKSIGDRYRSKSTP